MSNNAQELLIGLESLTYLNKQEVGALQLENLNISPKEKSKKRKCKGKMSKKKKIGSNITFDKKYKKLVPRLLAAIELVKEESGSPGISFAITHDGELVVKGGLGLADVENVVPCNELTSMRIASISKSLTSVAIGKMITFTFFKNLINTLLEY